MSWERKLKSQMRRINALFELNGPVCLNFTTGSLEHDVHCKKILVRGRGTFAPISAPCEAGRTNPLKIGTALAHDAC